MQRLKLFVILLLLSTFVTSCGPRSLEDFQEEGEGVILSLVQDLKMIRTREQLLLAAGKMQRQFDRLVSVIIAAEEFKLLHSGLEKEGFIRSNHDLSDQLRVELNRLYRLEGGRQIIEKYQEKALHRLAAFQRQHAKSQVPSSH